MRIGMVVVVDSFCELTEREVGSDHTHYLIFPLVERPTVRGHHLRGIDRPLVHVVEGIHPTGLFQIAWWLGGDGTGLDITIQLYDATGDGQQGV